MLGQKLLSKSTVKRSPNTINLQEEEPLCDLLYQLFWHILWEKLGPEFELEWVFLLHILLDYLESKAGHCDNDHSNGLTSMPGQFHKLWP